MRLLTEDSQGDLVLTEYHDTEIPPYAILSHRWGEENEEHTFKDVLDGTGKDKVGYRKIESCRKRAAKDDLDHFWIDTCCINKDSDAELSEAIRSMYLWYFNADVCYVFLNDVAYDPGLTQATSGDWQAEFRQSKWFTRGWTLQELLAPASVLFFSKEGKRLGNKRSLAQHIHEITGIPLKALRGESVTAFPPEDRLSWATHRSTKRQEDRAYSLFGLFDIQIPVLYGEGGERAFRRLRQEISYSSTDIPPTPASTVDSRSWRPRYYFFYGLSTNAEYLYRDLSLKSPPVLYPAFLEDCSVASTLHKWKVLLNGPFGHKARGAAYKVEHEWQESHLIRAETLDYVPSTCCMNMVTGDGIIQVAAKTFKYFGSSRGLVDVERGAKPFMHTGIMTRS